MDKTTMQSPASLVAVPPGRGYRRLNNALVAGLVALSTLLAGTPATAQPGTEAPVLYATEEGAFELAVNKSGVIRVDSPVKRVSVGNPGIVDVLVLRSSEIYLVGKAIGSTNVTLWNQEDRVFSTLNINVTQDLASLKQKLHELFPNDSIGVRSAQEQIVLSGQVSSLTRMDAATNLASGFLSECVDANSEVVLRDQTGGAPTEVRQGSGSRAGGGGGNCKKGGVINLMEVGGAQQVMLKVTIAEISRNVLKRMDADVNFFHLGKEGNSGAVSGGATFPDALIPPEQAGGMNLPFDPSIDQFVPNAPRIDNFGLFGSLLRGESFLQVVLDISRRNDLAKILAEPTLTTLSGQKAQFLSGGEFPIPVPQGGVGNNVTIEFKDFGVGVEFVPVILDSGHINLKLAVNVSDITQANNVLLSLGGTNTAFVVPSLTKRSAESTVELADGQTIGIAGLISDNVREFVEKFPLLGDIPVLGALFRSQEFRSDETELVIFVTPHLARPIAPSQVRLPTDSFVPPGSLEFYLLGRMESGSAPSRVSFDGAASDGGATGSSFGHAQ